MGRKKFCRLLNEAIDDESKAKQFYNRMKRGQTKVVRRKIDHVMRQEMGHNRIFRKMKREMCGK